MYVNSPITKYDTRDIRVEIHQQPSSPPPSPASSSHAHDRDSVFFPQGPYEQQNEVAAEISQSPRAFHRPVVIHVHLNIPPPPAAIPQTTVPQGQPTPPPAGPNGLLPNGLTTSGVLPLPPLPPGVVNPGNADTTPAQSGFVHKLEAWWRSIGSTERSYMCYCCAVCAFMCAILVLAVVPATISKKL